MNLTRRAALILALGAAGAGISAASDLPDASEGVPLRAMIGQMILIGFPGTKPAEEWPARVIKMIGESEIGGVILFPGNIVDLAQLKALDAALRKAGGATPPFIAVDQEGGLIQRLTPAKGFIGTPSAQKVAATDEAAAYGVYRAMARELAGVGINLNFGPVVDLAIDPNGPAIARLERSFGRDPNRVASFAHQFIDAHHDAGVLVAAKHFPGHGSAARDTHDEVVDVGQYMAGGGACTLPRSRLRPGRRHDHGRPPDPSALLRRRQAREPVAPGHPGRAARRARLSRPGHHRRPADGRDPGALRHRGGGRAGGRGRRRPDDLREHQSARSGDREPRARRGGEQAVEQGRVPRERIEEAYRRIVAAKKKLRDGKGRKAVDPPARIAWCSLAPCPRRGEG